MSWKNDHLSENLTLMYQQKKKKKKKKKKNICQSGENLETGATWNPCTYVYQSQSSTLLHIS